MDYRAWQKRVVTRLDGVLDARLKPRGAKRRLTDALGLDPYFFAELRKRAKRPKERIPFDRVFAVLNELGEHPAAVLYGAFRDLDPTLPKIPQLEPETAKTESSSDPFVNELLEELRRLKQKEAGEDA